MIKRICLILASLIFTALAIVMPFKTSRTVFADESAVSSFSFNSKFYYEYCGSDTTHKPYLNYFWFQLSTDTSITDSYGCFPFILSCFFKYDNGTSIQSATVDGSLTYFREFYSYGDLYGYNSQSDYGYHFTIGNGSGNSYLFGIWYRYFDESVLSFDTLTYKCIYPWDSEGDVDRDNYTCYTDIAYSTYSQYYNLSQYIFSNNGSAVFVIELISTHSYRASGSSFNYVIDRPRNYTYFLSDSSNSYYSAGYDAGLSAGQPAIYQNGYSAGYDVGQSVGYNTGFNDGYSNRNSWLGLMTAVVDAPVTYVTSLFDFNILGFNMLAFIKALFTMSVIVVILRLILGGGSSQ